ncbi:MAG: hypothetical protein Pg6A_19960 [Termitinemataceae bacterium]|nr:MAG: hypothetical protein Pg6A_19960 [Termitinemataceae bacterium]
MGLKLNGSSIAKPSYNGASINGFMDGNKIWNDAPPLPFNCRVFPTVPEFFWIEGYEEDMATPSQNFVVRPICYTMTGQLWFNTDLHGSGTWQQYTASNPMYPYLYPEGTDSRIHFFFQSDYVGGGGKSGSTTSGTFNPWYVYNADTSHNPTGSGDLAFKRFKIGGCLSIGKALATGAEPTNADIIGDTQLRAAFKYMFFDPNSSGYKSRLFNLDALFMPNRTIARDAYKLMFAQNTGFTSIPYDLFCPCNNPITTDTESMVSMFQYCDNLTNAAMMYLATCAGTNALQYMYANTGVLKVTKGLLTWSDALQTDTNWQLGCQGMFATCPNLTEIEPEAFFNLRPPNISSSQSASRHGTLSLDEMFRDCTALTTLPSNMFDRDVAIYTNGTAWGRCAITCKQMFENCTALTTLPEDLFAPLVKNYHGVTFNGTFKASGVTHVPKIFGTNPYPEALPAGSTSSANSRCINMFTLCTDLVTIDPGALPFTKLLGYDYSYMFNGCSNFMPDASTLKQLLHFNTITQTGVNSYNYMFTQCTNLATASGGKIGNIFDGVTNLSIFDSTYVFQGMFRECLGITDLRPTPFPDIYFTFTGSNTFRDMFGYCKNLEYAMPSIKFTPGSSCYYSMFDNCNNLKIAPELDFDVAGTSVALMTYMFRLCTSLQEIKVHFSAWPASGAITNWMTSVPGAGLTFYKPTSLPTTYGVNNIPTGATVVSF